MRSFIVLLIIAVLSSCASSSVSGYKTANVGVGGFKYVAVTIGGYDDETATKIAQTFCANVSVKCLSFNQVVATNRNATQQEVGQYLLNIGVDSFLQIGYGGDMSKFEKIYENTQTHHQGTIRQTGQNTYDYQGTSTQTTTPVYQKQRATSTQVKLVDFLNAKTVWVGNVSTEGFGLIGASDSSMIGSSMKKLAASLKKQGFVH